MARAVEELEALLDKASDQVLALQAITRIQLYQRNWEAALEMAARLKDAQPADQAGYVHAGLVHQGAGRSEEAMAELEKALDRAPDDPQVLAALTRGSLAAEAGESGAGRLQEALARNPDNFLVQNLLGELLTVLQRGEEAEATFREVISERPDWPLPYRNLAALYLAREETDKAVDTLREGIDATNGNAALVMQLAGIFERQRDFEEARAEYERLLARYPEMQFAANNLAMLLVDAASEVRDLDRAAELLSVLEGSNSPLVMDTVGWVHFRRGDLDGAVAVLERAATRASHIPVIQYHLGMVYASQGRAQDAELALNRALPKSAEFPGAEEARATLAKLKSS